MCARACVCVVCVVCRAAPNLERNSLAAIFGSHPKKVMMMAGRVLTPEARLSLPAAQEDKKPFPAGNRNVNCEWKRKLYGFYVG